jgi:hypothetical protein
LKRGKHGHTLDDKGAGPISLCLDCAICNLRCMAVGGF